MNIHHGVTTETLNNLEFEQGIILKNPFTTSASFNKDTDVLCSTTGGIRVVVNAVVQNIEFDGVLENTKETKRVIGYTASVQFSTKEVDAEKVKLALGYAGITTTSGKQTITLQQGVVPSSTYEEHLYVLGKLGNGTWRQIVIDNVMNVGGLNETRNSKNEVEIAFDLQANYGIDTQDNPPVHIEYITEAT